MGPTWAIVLVLSSKFWMAAGQPHPGLCAAAPM
jgi:hypothetical protein